MDQQQQSRWRPTSKQVLWTVGIILVLVGVLILLRFAYVHEWKWTGLVKNPSFQKRTLWDWLNLLIVPAVLALGGYFFTRSENRRTQEVAETRAQDEALQAYLDQMGHLLLEKRLRQSEEDGAEESGEAQTLARARTQTILKRLDACHKRSIVEFLYEAQLIFAGSSVLDLKGVDLSGADLRGGNLSDAKLSGANLMATNLRDTNLSRANLNSANLKDANLSLANLTGAKGLTKEQLDEAGLLTGATMPKGFWVRLFGA